MQIYFNTYLYHIIIEKYCLEIFDFPHYKVPIFSIDKNQGTLL